MIRRLPSGATSLLVAVIVFLTTTLAAAALIWKLESHRLDGERARIASHADDYAQDLQRKIERTLSVTYALAAMVRQGHGSFPDFEEVASQLLRFYPSADSLQLAPDGVTRHIVPLSGNEKGLGRDLLRDPLRSREALLARDSRQLTLAGPFELIQGGVGIIGRFPVFLEDAGGSEHFWGFTTVVIRFPDILDNLRRPHLSEHRFAYELWRIHPDTGRKQIIAASSTTPLKQPVERLVIVPNGRWTLSLSPVAGWADPVGLSLKIAFGLLFSTLLAWLAKLLVESKVYAVSLGKLVTERTTELTRTIEALRQERDFSDAALDSLPGVFYLYDEQLRFLRWNRNLEQVLGYGADEIARMIPLDFFAGDDRALLTERIRSVFEQGSAEVEADFVAKDGTRLPYYFTGVRTTIAGQNCLLGVGIDISARREAGKTLRVSEERLRLFIEHAPAALAMFDCSMRYLQVSRRWLADYGLGERSLLGLSHYEVFPEISDMWREIHRRGLAGEVIRAEADRFERSDGTMQWLRWEVRPWFNVEGKIGGIVIFSEDISERKQAEEERQKLVAELEKRNAELERFTYTVSHDLKSPLVTILGFTGQLAQDLREQATENIEADLAFIRGAAGQMNELLDSLLQLSRAGRSLSELHPVALAELTHKAIEQFGDRLAHARLEIDIPSDLPVLMGDPLRLREVLQNLLENAVKFSREAVDPRVEIGCRRGDSEVVCFVRDNGIGVAAEYQEKIFGLFEQLDPRAEGTGIGLAIARRIVEEHGGRVWVESAGKGQGSTFYFTLPMTVQS